MNDVYIVGRVGPCVGRVRSEGRLEMTRMIRQMWERLDIWLGRDWPKSEDEHVVEMSPEEESFLYGALVGSFATVVMTLMIAIALN